MVKDRLKEFQMLAFSNGNKYEPDDPDSELKVKTEELIRSQLFAEVKEIREMIDKLQALVEGVKLKHSTILTAWNVNEKTYCELENLRAEMRKAFYETRGMLKHIERNIEIEVEKQINKIGAANSNLNRGYKSANLRMTITQHAALWHELVEVMTEYNSAQADFRDRCKNQILRQLQITDQNVSEEELDTLLEQNNLSLFTNGIITETQREKRKLADIEVQYADFVRLETSIQELNDMYIDLAVLTKTQGEMINRIECNVNSSVDDIEEGLDDVADAVNIVNSTRRTSTLRLEFCSPMVQNRMNEQTLHSQCAVGIIPNGREIVDLAEFFATATAGDFPVTRCLKVPFQ